MYKYVNKTNETITVGGITILPYGGHTSTTAIPALDLVSNGLGFERYINEVLSNTTNDPLGETKTLITGVKNIYVSTEGSNGNSGEQNSPFRTIQYALDHVAKYYRFGNIDTNKCIINVDDGTYEETIIVPKFTEMDEVSYVEILGNTTAVDLVTIYPLAGSYNGVRTYGRYSNCKLTGITIDGTRIASYGVIALCDQYSILSFGNRCKIKSNSDVSISSIGVYGNSYCNTGYCNNLVIDGVVGTVFSLAEHAYLYFYVENLTLTNCTGTYFILSYDRCNVYWYCGSTTGTFATGLKYALYHQSQILLESAESTIPGGVAGTVADTSQIVVYPSGE